MSIKCPIRVLCVFSTLDRGGAESMCMNLYRHIDKNKVQFDFVKHTSKKGAFEDEIMSLGGRIFEAPRLKVGKIITYCQWWSSFLDNHPEYHVIHGHFFGISPVYFSIAKRKKRITIGHSHISKADRLTKAILCKFISRTSDYAFACSKLAGEWIFHDRQFTVLNNAIDSKLFRADAQIAKEVRDEFLLGDNLVIGNVSRFNLQKNPYGILEIFCKIHEKCPHSKLLWVGDGPMKEEITEKAKNQGVLPNVVFTGVRNDVPRLLQAMDAFLFPSFYEGLGIAAVEAQAAGVQTFCSTAVPEEAGVTELCHFISLENLDIWAQEISTIPANYLHLDMTEQIKKSGYDIHDTAVWLQNFYLSIQ